ncbi:hypothetical protein JMJ77_0002038, partial [Colletotrichum scovillei]
RQPTPVGGSALDLRSSISSTTILDQDHPAYDRQLKRPRCSRLYAPTPQTRDLGREKGYESRNMKFAQADARADFGIFVRGSRCFRVKAGP